MRIIFENKNGRDKRVEQADKRDRRQQRRQKAERDRWAVDSAFTGAF